MVVDQRHQRLTRAVMIVVEPVQLVMRQQFGNDEAAVDRAIGALEPTKLRVVFFTHLHSDHTVGFADLILTPWVVGRQEPLEVYGPRGIKAMSAHILEAYSADFEARTKDETMARGASRGGHQVNAHEINAGVVYKDENVTVTAFAVKHVMESYGYRFDTVDRSIVISGDTTPAQSTIDACHGCDVLIHEVTTQEFLTRHPERREYSSQAHTNTTQLAALAAQAKPGLLILYHATISWRPAVDSERSRPEELLGEMMPLYSGHVVVGRDLDVY